MRGSRGRILVGVWCVAALLLAGSTTVWGQVGTASLVGTVKDTQGAIVPGATVTVTNIATGSARASATNDSGVYQFIGLPPGLYDLTIELSGFRTAKLTKLELRVDSTTRTDVPLEVGSLAETVTVQGESPLINTTDASLGNVLNEQAIRNLPVEARNVVQLLSLQPGAVFIPTNNPNTVDPRYGSVAGARSDQQNVTLDGVDVNDPQLQAAYTSAVRVTQEALQEFRVSMSNYGAEMGRSSGPQVSLVTKSGTNQFDGSAYWFLRRTATSSNEYFLKLAQLGQGKESKAPVLDKDIFGGAIGGPIRRNRMFFFGNFEGLKEQSESPVVRGVPSASFRDGILIYRCQVAAQCPATSVRGFTGTHAVPAGWYGLTPAEIAALDPLGIGPSRAASQYFSQYPLPNEPGLDGNNIMDYRFSAPIENDLKTFISRLDFRPSEKGTHNFFFRANAQDDTINAEPQFPGQDPRSATVVQNMGFAVGYDTVLSSNLMNSFRYGLTRIDSGTIGQTNGNYTSFRFISVFEASQGATFTSARETPTQNIVNDLSWLKGRHTFKVGTNLRFTRIPSSRDSGSYLSATVNPSWVDGIGRVYMPGGARCPVAACTATPAVATGFQAGYADAWLNILGVLSQSTVRANYLKDGTQQAIGEPVTRKYATDEYDFYVQDSWQLRRNLTVNAGIRYSLGSPPYEVNGLQVAPTISMGEWFAERERMMKDGTPSSQSPIVTFDLAGPKNNRRGYYDWDKNNAAPRVSFAWTPGGESGFLGKLTGNGRMVIRGGYSKVFDRLGQGIATNFDGAFAFGMSTSISSPFGAPYETNPNVRFRDTSTMPPTIPAAPPGGFPQTPPIRAGIITTSIDDTITTPSAHMVNLAVAREFGPNFSLEGAYIGRFGRDLLVRRDIAMPLNLVDPRSGMDYFTAAQQVIQATQNAGITGSARPPYAVLPAIAYWENLFPAAAGGGLTATQAIARRFNLDAPDYITSLWLMDQFCVPGCSIFGPFAYFAEQYDSLASLSSLGRSNYHAMVLTLRKRFSQGYQFDLNYTLSESKDMGSNVERGGAFGNFSNGGYTGFLVNSWEPELNYGNSDFDVRHQVNFNWIAELPFGQGRAIGTDAPAWLNQFIGDWSVAGLVRWTSGFPFNVINCRSCWPTNWNLQGNAMLVDPNRLPETGLTRNAVDGRPSPWENATDALTFFRRALPGEVGLRNVFRGDGYFTIDLSVSKAWGLPFGDHKLRFRWDTFNATNTPKFDVGNVTMTPDRTGFGRYNGTLATCDAQAGRCMQFALRYEF